MLYTFENTPQCVVGENAATFPYAPIYFKNGYVKEFIVSGNKHSGFVVSISELSKKCFETKKMNHTLAKSFKDALNSGTVIKTVPEK